MRVPSFLGRNASYCDFKQLFPGLAGVALHCGTGVQKTLTFRSKKFRLRRFTPKLAQWAKCSLRSPQHLIIALGRAITFVNRHSTVTHYQRPNMTHPQEGGTGGEVSEILFFSAKSKLRPSLIYSMQIIPVCLSIAARRKGDSATRRGGLNWTPISLLVGHPCKLFHSKRALQKKTMSR